MYNKEKIYLFDGSNFDNWLRRDGGKVEWENDGECMTVVDNGQDIVSTVKYSDALIHVEFRTPDMPEESGQGKGNSGVYVHGCYEVQVLDSYGVENLDWGDCGSVYNMYRPLVNACKPALEWQTYDIIFRAPKFNEYNEMTSPARMTILQNGLPVQNNVILHRVTPGGLSSLPVREGPLMLQDHGDSVSFRNVYIIKLDD